MEQIIKNRIEQIKQGRVPQGYKKTPCGVLPCEWGMRRLWQIFDRNNNRNDNNVVTNVLTISAQQGLISQTNYFNKDIASEDRKNYLVLKKDSFAYNKSYSTGYPFGAIKKLKLYDSGILSPLYICFDHKKDLSNIDFYEQYFESGALNHQINNYAQEGARNHGLLNLSIGDFFNSQLAFPPLSEQEKIAELLAIWDKAIEKQKMLIDKLEFRKKALMQKLFAPEESWDKRKISDVGKVVTGNTPSTINGSFFGGKYMWVTPTDIVGKYQYCSERTLTENGIKEIRFLPQGTVLITCIASIGKNCIMRKDGACNQQINALIVNDDYCNEFVYYIITYKTAMLRKLAGKSATQIISKSLFESVVLYYPKLKEQQKIADILTSADNEIEKQNKLFKRLQTQKKSLMQLLLTGIVRVSEK